MVQLLKRIFPLVFGLVLGAGLTANAQTSNFRSLYLKDVDVWCGNTTTENTILNYCSGNGFNYIIFYDLGSFDFSSTTKKNQLAAFMSRARQNYGITQFGASGEVYSFFRDYIIPYNNGRTSSAEKFEVFNFEFEWWVSSSVASLYCSKYLTPNGYSCDSAGAWRFSWNEFKKIDSAAAANGRISEYYLGWPTTGHMQQVVSRTDRLLLHAYRPTDVDVYSYSRNRLIDAASTSATVTILPIFSSEPSFMGPWLASNPVTKPYTTYSNAYIAETGSWKSRISLQGYTWFHYGYMPATTSAVATITTSGPTTFCSGGSVTLTANSGSAYLWSPGGQTTRSITVSSSGSYTVRVTNASGASATSSPVVVNASGTGTTPTITASGPTTFCPGSSVTLTASSGSTYRWSTGATTQSINVTTSGNYNVTVTSGGCSGTSSNTAVTVTSTYPTPTITSSGTTAICQGSAITLTSTSANGYLWSNGATSRSIVVSSAGTYWVRAYGGPSCFAQSSNYTTTLLSPPATPTITASGSTTLTASHTSVVLTSSSANAYNWSNGSATRSVTITTQGSYRVTITGSNGCKATSNAVNVSANGCTPPTAPSITLSGSNILASGQTVTLTSTTAGGYLWSNGATTRSITVSTAGTYSVRAYSGGNCFSTSLPVSVYVVQSLPPVPTGNDPMISDALRLNPDQVSTGRNMIAFPNPAADLLQIDFESVNESENFLISLIDLSGRQVIRQQVNSITGLNRIGLNVADLPRGVYFAYLAGDRTTDYVKVVLQ